MRATLSMLMMIGAITLGLTGWGEFRKYNRGLGWFYFVLAGILLLSSFELMPRHASHPELEDPNYDTTPNP